VSDFVFDWEREARTGVAEAVLCEPKTPAQIAAILETAATKDARLLLTRLSPARRSSADRLPARRSRAP
jgi:NCAIR mutase (PurE)-related protein